MYSILLSDYVKGFSLVNLELKKLIKKDCKVVLISWAFPIELDYHSFNNEWFKKDGTRYNKYVKPLLDLGLNKNQITILNCYDKNNIHNFKNIIKNSDILVICGGNPEMLYSKVVQETEILYEIKHYKGIIIGASAGADLQLKRYFITAKNNYYKYFAFYDGFGILDDPFYLDVHSINNHLYLSKLQKIAEEKQKNIYAIFDDGAIIFNRANTELKIFGNVKLFEPNILKK